MGVSAILEISISSLSKLMRVSIGEKLRLLEKTNYTRSDFLSVGLGVESGWQFCKAVPSISISFKRNTYIPNPRRFSREEVDLIRSLYRPKIISYSQLARQFSTCKATIDHVINFKGAYREF